VLAWPTSVRRAFVEELVEIVNAEREGASDAP